MKKNLIFAFTFVLLLFSCKKEEELNNLKTISMEVEFEGKKYDLEYFKNEETGEIINSEKNNEFNLLTQNYEESVLALFGEKTYFFKTREDYFSAVIEDSKYENKSLCWGSANYVTQFFRDVNYNNLMDSRLAIELSSYETYKMFWGGGLLSSDNATNLNEWAENVYGFKVPNVGSQNNDELSSVRIMKFNANSNFPNNTIPQTDFTCVMFQDADYRGRAIAIHANACQNTTSISAQYPDFTVYNMTAFKKWNDNVSSYSGYYKQLNWLN